MDNGKCIMDNEGVAFGDTFGFIFEENTTIVNYPLSIIHYSFVRQHEKWQFVGKDKHKRSRPEFSLRAVYVLYRASFRSFSLIQPHLRRISQKTQLRIAGSTKQISIRPTQSMAVMAFPLLTQPVYTPI